MTLPHVLRNESASSGCGPVIDALTSPPSAHRLRATLETHLRATSARRRFRLLPALVRPLASLPLCRSERLPRREKRATSDALDLVRASFSNTKLDPRALVHLRGEGQRINLPDHLTALVHALDRPRPLGVPKYGHRLSGNGETIRFGQCAQDMCTMRLVRATVKRFFAAPAPSSTGAALAGSAGCARLRPEWAPGAERRAASAGKHSSRAGTQRR